MKKVFKVLFVLFCLIIWFGATKVWAQEFSADMESRVGKETTSAKIYVSGPKVRMEMAEMTMIILNDKKISLMVMPAEKMYMEHPIDTQRAPKVEKNFDGEIERVSMGKETVNGQDTEKFKVTYLENGKTVSAYQWLKDQTIPVRIEAVDGSWSMDYKNLKIGAQPADLFEPPAGYAKMGMPDLKSIMGGLGQ